MWLLHPPSRTRASCSAVCILGTFSEADNAISAWLDKHAKHGAVQIFASFYSRLDCRCDGRADPKLSMLTLPHPGAELGFARLRP